MHHVSIINKDFLNVDSEDGTQVLTRIASKKMVLTIVRCTLNVNEPKSNRILVSEYNTFAFRPLLYWYTEPDYCKTFKLFEALKFQEKCL